MWLTTPESIPDGLVGGRNKHVIWDIVKKRECSALFVWGVRQGGNLRKDQIPWILSFAFASVRLASKKFKALSENEKAVYQD